MATRGTRLEQLTPVGWSLSNEASTRLSLPNDYSIGLRAHIASVTRPQPRYRSLATAIASNVVVAPSGESGSVAHSAACMSLIHFPPGIGLSQLTSGGSAVIGLAWKSQRPSPSMAHSTS